MLHKNVSVKKCFDYINLETFEVCFSAFFAVLTIIVLNYIEFYTCFNQYIDTIQGIVSCIIGAFVAILGLLLSGIAFISSLFTKEFIDAIDKGLKIMRKKGQIKQISGHEATREILASFSFISLHVGIMICFYSVLYLILYSTKPIILKSMFWIITLLLVYFFYFTIFYVVALIFNCVRLNNIKNQYQNAHIKTFFEKANEVRIDMLLSTVLSNYEGDKKALLMSTLSEFVGRSFNNEQERDELMEYFKKIYDSDKNK